LKRERCNFLNEILLALMELHTFSRLDKAFLHQYQNSMKKADIAVVLFDPQALALKKLPPITQEDVKEGFKNPKLLAFTNSIDLEAFIQCHNIKNKNLLTMIAGNFGGINLKILAKNIINKNPII